jgi:hypothetical protein
MNFRQPVMWLAGAPDDIPLRFAGVMAKGLAKQSQELRSNA